MIFDTNAISALSRNEPALLKILPSDRPWYLPTIVLGEYRFGLCKSRRADVLEPWLDRVEEACQILCPDHVTARHYALIRNDLESANLRIPYHDIWIGALAVQHNLPVLSRDKHFDRIANVERKYW